MVSRNSHLQRILAIAGLAFLLLFLLRLLSSETMLPLRGKRAGEAAEKSVTDKEHRARPSVRDQSSSLPDRKSAYQAKLSSAASLALLPDSHSPAFPDEAKDILALTYDLEKSFADVEEEFGVPADLLKAIAQVESSGEHNGGFQNSHGGRGIMGLKHTGSQPMIERAAQLLGSDARTVIADPVQNIRAAAALLRFYRGGFASGEQTWARAVDSFSGRDAAEAVNYVQQVRKILDDGVQSTGEAGSNLTIPPGQAHLLDSQ